MNVNEKRIVILLQVKIEELTEDCVRKMFKQVYEYLIIDEDYERCSKIREKEKLFNDYIKNNKDKVKKNTLRFLKL